MKLNSHFQTKNKIVIFRCDANASCGAGHLMRCMALAYRFQSGGVKPLFLIDANSVNFVSAQDDFIFDHQVVGRDFDETGLDETELEEISNVLKRQDAIALVLDGYQFNENYRKHLKARLSIPMVILDDCNNSGQLYADMVINPVSQASKLDYPSTAPNATLLLGPDYTLLRPEFSLPCDTNYLDRKACLITFGGADLTDLTIPVVQHLIEELSEVAPLTVVTGGAYQNLSAFEKLLSSTQTDIRHHHQVSHMSPILKQAKLAISAAGGTIFELGAMGVPTLLMVVADNQLNAALEQQEKGGCQVLDVRGGVSYKKLISVVRALWNNETLRLEMHKKALDNAVIDGADRAVNEIISHSCRRKNRIEANGICLRAIESSDLELVRAWRNDPDISQFMISQEMITQTMQKSWFNSIKADLSQQHFMIEYKSSAIGVMNIKSLTGEPLGQAKEIEPGMYIYDPRYRGNFLAFCPALTLNDYCFNTLNCERLVAKVFVKNSAAIRFNEALGYRTIEKNGLDVDELITMELSEQNYQQKSQNIRRLIRF